MLNIDTHVKLSLQPCPFCGRDPWIFIQRSRIYVQCHDRCATRSAEIKSTICEGYALEDIMKAYQEVEKKWNTRMKE